MHTYMHASTHSGTHTNYHRKRIRFPIGLKAINPKQVDISISLSCLLAKIYLEDYLVPQVVAPKPRPITPLLLYNTFNNICHVV